MERSRASRETPVPRRPSRGGSKTWARHASPSLTTPPAPVDLVHRRRLPREPSACGDASGSALRSWFRTTLLDRHAASGAQRARGARSPDVGRVRHHRRDSLRANGVARREGSHAFGRDPQNGLGFRLPPHSARTGGFGSRRSEMARGLPTARAVRGYGRHRYDYVATPQRFVLCVLHLRLLRG